MAASDQIKGLINSFAEDDENRFYNIAMQIAASEARKGHKNLARDLRDLIDRAKEQRDINSLRSKKPTPLRAPKGELSDLLEVYYPQVKLSDMVLKKSVKDSLARIVNEHNKLSILKQHNLDARRKIMLLGNPGCGKTMTAKALAGELKLPILIVRLDGLITKYMGESIAKLRLIFEEMKRNRGVYLFDEFDSIGVARSYDNEVGEIKRVLNSFLINIERDDSNSLIIAASNRVNALDEALFRRFDDIIKYDIPNENEIDSLLKISLSNYQSFNQSDINKIIKSAVGHSHAEIVRACNEAVKSMLLSNTDKIESGFIVDHLNSRG